MPREDSTDRWLKVLTVISTLRQVMGGGSESTIAAHEQFEKRGASARSNAGNVLLGGLLIVTCAALLLAGWWLATGTAWSALGIMVGGVVVVILTAGLAVGLSVWSARPDGRGGVVYAIPFRPAFVGSLTLVWGAAFTLLMVVNVGAAEWQRLGGMGVSAVAVVCGITGYFLAYNGRYNLERPYEWPSPDDEHVRRPLGEATAGILKNMMADGGQPVIVERRAIRQNGNGVKQLAPIESEEPETMDADGWRPDPEQHNLVFLGLLAAGSQSLSYGPLLARKLTLPGIETGWSGPRPLNKETLALLLRRGAAWGWWELSGPRSSARLLLEDWAELRAEALGLWYTLTDDELPLPDPFGGTYEIAPYSLAA